MRFNNIFVEESQQLQPDNLSFTQLNILWNSQQSQQPCNTTYAAWLHGEVDRAVFDQSVADLYQHYGSLWEAWLSGGDDAAFVVTYSDKVPGADAVPEIIHQAHRTSLDINASLLFRVAVHSQSATKHLLVLTAHRLLLADSSWPQVLSDLLAIYAAHTNGENPVLSSFPLAAGRPNKHSLNFWTTHLSGISSVMDLPLDKARPATQSLHGEAVAFSLSKPQSAALVSTAQSLHAEIADVLLAAYSALMFRYTGQESVVIGIPGATHIATQDFLPLHTLAGDEVTFRDFLKQVVKTKSDAWQQQPIPYEDVMHALGHISEPSYMPLAQLGFAFAPIPANKANTLRLSPVAVAPRTTVFDLNLNLYDDGSTLTGEFVYATTLFDGATIQRLATHFQNLLDGITANPATALIDLPLLSDAERHQLVVEWNQSQKDVPQDTVFHRLLESQAAKTPDKIAARFQGQALTYAELNRGANRIAHILLEKGLQSETVVGIMAERSTDFLTAMLGIFKAGGVYLPIDPRYPQLRIQQVVEQSKTAFVLTTQEFMPKLQEALTDQSHVENLLLEDMLNVTGSDANPDVDVKPEDLAYIIFTSGSTGLPKGAQVEHRGMLNHLYAKIYDLDLNENDIVAQNAPQSFDISVWQFLIALVLGATTHVYDDEVAKTPDRLIADVAKDKITVLEVVPSIMRVMIESLSESGDAPLMLPMLRWLIPTGEALPPTLARQWLERYPQIPLVNAYGPTECSDDVTHYFVYDPPPKHVINMPIGRPVANMQMYILDHRLQPVPIGVRGELYVGGIGVGRGYINDPTRTALAFMADPFSDDPEARFYKTGDVARYLPDGNIEFMGRVDFQVKVNGLRIELNEIEFALENHPAIRQSVVTLYDIDANRKHMAAYIVPIEQPAPSVSELATYLKDHIPQYMVPSAFVFMDELPLTPNGKINRNALPVPDTSNQLIVEDATLPTTPIEMQLADIWLAVLKLPTVGINTSFFELGGDSLQATQVTSRIRDTFQIAISLYQIFETSTIAGLAQFVEAQQQQANGGAGAPIPRISRDREYYNLSKMQESMWFLHYFQQENTAYNVRIPVRITGKLQIRIFQKALNALVQRHETLRTTFTQIDGQPFQIIHDTMTIPLMVLDLQHMSAEEQEVVVYDETAKDQNHRFDLSHGPLAILRLFRLDEEDFVFLCTMHHIISDGWSEGVFVEDLVQLYDAFTRDEPSPLPELPIQYVDYTYWHNEQWDGDNLRRQIDYWKQQLHGIPPLLDLPTDRARPVEQTFNGKMHIFSVGREYLGQLKNVGKQADATLFMTGISLYAILLARYSGMNDFAIGVPIASRTHSKLENVIGFFINQMPFRVKIDDQLTFIELLELVRQTALEFYENQDLLFTRLVEEVNPERSAAYYPIVQVAFNAQGNPIDTIELPDLKVAYHYVPEVGAYTDLVLHMDETTEGLKFQLKYNTDLFNQSTMERMAAVYIALMEQVNANPHQRIAELSLVSEAEADQLRQWNVTARDYALDKTIHALFEEQVIKTPNAVAVFDEKVQYTYVELNQKANQMAHHLLSIGVKGGDAVGLSVYRAPEMIIAMLGILKIGAAYLPLDPTYPQSRLEYMIDNSGAKVLVTYDDLLELFPNYTGQVVLLDQVTNSSTENPAIAVRADQVAYVIYTSGSTGQPKGVLGLHQGAVNRFKWMWEDYPFEDNEVCCQKTSINFVDHVWEIFGPLLAGVPNFVVADVILRNTAQFIDTLSEQQISRIVLVPSLLNTMLDIDDNLNTKLENLKLWITSGEAIPVDTLLRFRKALPQSTLLNLYGSSEVAADATYFDTGDLNLSENDDVTSVPIGKPIANMQVHILDRNLKPVPKGVNGNIYVAGVGLAGGYINRPDLTAERFIPNPYDGDGKGLMYQTGDIGRFLPDGNVEFAGRSDHQVKIRGFRIELGEVEWALKQHVAVDKAVLTIHGDESTKRLVAYIVCHKGMSVNNNQLRDFLEDSLPDYMIPYVFVMLDALPLTPNGKTDFKALPEPTVASQVVEISSSINPRNTVEQKLQGLWQDILEVESVGVHDNFFELGGHSLMAARLQVYIERTFKKNVSLGVLLRTPTIAEQAQIIQPEAIVASVQTGSKTGEKIPQFFWAHGTDFPNFKGTFGAEQPIYTLFPPGFDDKDAIVSTVAELVAYYVKEILAVQAEGPFYIGGYCEGGVVSLAIAEELVGLGHTVGVLAMLDVEPPDGVKQSREQRGFREKVILSLKTGRFLTLVYENIRDIIIEPIRDIRLKLTGNATEALLFQLTEARNAAIEPYVASPYNGYMVFFESEETVARRGNDWRERWAALNTGTNEFHEVPGTHVTMHQPPGSVIIAKKVKEILLEHRKANKR